MKKSLYGQKRGFHKFARHNKICRSKFKYYSYVRVIIVTLIAHIKIQLRCINNTASRILKYVYEFHSNFHPFNPIKTLLNSASRKKSIHQYVYKTLTKLFHYVYFTLIHRVKKCITNFPKVIANFK